MFNVKGYAIEVSRGDTGELTVTFNGDVPPDDTVALVTLQKTLGKPCSPTHPQDIWSKRINVADGKIGIIFTSEDTNQPAGKYLWDIRLLYANGDVYTPIKPTEFTIVEVVGNA